MAKIFLLYLIPILVLATKAQAAVDPQVLCLVSSEHYERKHNIPRNLLRSISIVESGRWNSTYKVSIGWPWVVAIDGRGQFFKTYNDAAVFLRQAIARGENVDIGCHQINWKHHGHHFDRPEILLHPRHNAEYAAHFLVQNYKETKDWHKAVAFYHSRTPELGNKYSQKVHNILQNMQGELDQKYRNYIRDMYSQFKSNKKNSTIFVSYNHDKVTPVQSKLTNNMVVFSQEVELPANLVILD